MSVSEEFLEDLRSALAHLHDPAYLESHPFAARLRFVAQAPDLSRGKLLARTLRLAIEALDPGAGVAPNAPEARPYHLLRGRYIAQRDLVRLAEELDIGERQAYRELRRGVEALAQILCHSDQIAPEDGEPELGSPPQSRVKEEVERLTNVTLQDVDLQQLLAGIVASAQCLAQQQGILLQLELQAEGLTCTTNRVLLRQAILNLLSHALGTTANNQPVLLRLIPGQGEALLELTYSPTQESAMTDVSEPYAVAQQVLASLNLQWTREKTAEGGEIIQVRIPVTRTRSVLLIDDNQGLIRLFCRYLRHQPYRVYSATNADEALAMLDQLQPDVIILDIMMPERDGWEVLQALRQRDAGRRARIVICSIINDPKLSAALGADAFLHKPVDQASLLQVLERLGSAT
jgi:CheY-like chemotaxis protein